MFRSSAVAIVFVGALGLTLVALLGFGVSTHVFGVAITARNPARPFAVAGIAAALLVAWSPRAARGFQTLADRLAPERVHLLTAAGIAVMVTAVAIVHGSFVASASDGYGYVAQAKLLASGALMVPQEWARTYAWPDVEAVWSPLGFQPSLDGGSLVPAYPPGLPMLMAGFATLGGERAMYLVVPLAAGVLVLGTFLLGSRADGSPTGLIAALLLACSPIFLFHACLPMSDVPASAASTMAIVLSLRGGSTRAWLSGFCAGLTVLIRPNLAPLLIVPVVAIAMASEEPTGTRLRRIALVAAGAFPAVVVLALLNRAWHGSVIGSGYQVGDLFRAEHVWPNLFSYPSWLVGTQTAFILLAPVGLFLVRRDRLVFALVPAIVWLSYLFYAPLNHWSYLRFLLPAFPALLVLASACAVRAIQFPLAGSIPLGLSRRVAIVTLVGVVALTTWHEARVRGAFEHHVSLDRFVAVPRFARSTLSERAVFLTLLYSGSMREYGDRPTVRWDVLDPAWLDRAVADLQARGHDVFIVIEGADERQQFVDRFAAHSRWGRLDWPPAAEYAGVETVWLYDVTDRDRSTHDVRTRAIPH